MQPANPQLDPIDDLNLANYAWADAPLSQNVASAMATGVLCEYQVPLDAKGNQRYDGHFVVFDNPQASLQANAFLGTHVQTGIARLLP